jgi:hypothetical protein
MKKVSRNRDRVMAAAVAAADLQHVRGGATAIEYGLLVAPPTTSTDAAPTVK